MNWTLEVLCVPVSDVDRAKSFYVEKVGFRLDHDHAMGEDYRVVQLTPPGSGCSIVIGTVTSMVPGSLNGMQLVVPDVRAARAELAGRGVEVSEVQAFGHDGDSAVLEKGELDNVGFCYFSDPDGNTWAVQQISSRG
jgi:catechol 2,3-dioxygenase-like lactoylglutathione lyase family enzyme